MVFRPSSLALRVGVGIIEEYQFLKQLSRTGQPDWRSSILLREWWNIGMMEYYRRQMTMRGWSNVTPILHSSIIPVFPLKPESICRPPHSSHDSTSSLQPIV